MQDWHDEDVVFLPPDEAPVVTPKRIRGLRKIKPLAERILALQRARLRRNKREKTLGTILQGKVKAAGDYLAGHQHLRAIRGPRGFAFLWADSQHVPATEGLEGPPIIKEELRILRTIQHPYGIVETDYEAIPETPERCWITVYTWGVIGEEFLITAGGIDCADAAEYNAVMIALMHSPELGDDGKPRTTAAARSLL